MRFLSILIFGLLFSYTATFAQTYITNVTIGDVEKQQLVAHQTVVITNDMITNIHPADRVDIPANATIIEGEGKYLFPGWIDAHIHFSQTGSLYTRPDAINLRNVKPYQEEIDWSHDHMEEVLRRYLQNGITTVMDVGTTINFLKQRTSFSESTFAPAIYMSGPLLTTYEPAAFKGLGDDSPFNLVTSVDNAKKLVQQQLPYHPDFIKIWYIVGQDTSDIEASARNYLPIIKAIIDEAHKNKIRMAVHATERITAQLAVENGCDYLVHSVDDEVLSDDFIQLLKKHKTILCPTLVVHDGYVKTFGQRLDLSAHELRMADPFQAGSLQDLKHLADTSLVNRYRRALNTPERLAEVQNTNAIMMENLKRLSDAGVIIATGTDAGNIGTLHASSYLTEVLAMQKSGMTNWQILQASTLHGAKVMNKEKEFGTITKGKKANLVLLDANPAEDIANMMRIHRVINKGVVIDPDTLIKDTPVALVHRQLNGYNFQSIEAFLEPYAEDVEIYIYPDQLLRKGKENMRKAYATMFENSPNLHCEILERTVQGNVVTDKERVQDGHEVIEATVMYHIKNDKIQKVYFVQ
jgi:imidazolonepropionase-like amidohydrolase